MRKLKIEESKIILSWQIRWTAPLCTIKQGPRKSENVRWHRGDLISLISLISPGTDSQRARLNLHFQLERAWACYSSCWNLIVILIWYLTYSFGPFPQMCRPRWQRAPRTPITRKALVNNEQWLDLFLISQVESQQL